MTETKSNPSSRKFLVTLEHVFSDTGLINCAVPQGFILGPLLFLIYINDLPQALNETYIYDDDTCIFFQDKNVDKVLIKEFSLFCEWFKDNELSL